MSFINKEYTKEQDEEFKEWLFERIYNDGKFRKEFLDIDTKNGEIIRQAIDEFNFYLPKIKNG